MFVPRLLLALLLSPGPPCAEGEVGNQYRLVQRDLNLARLDAGLRPLSTHPVFCRLAAERAADVAANGSSEVDLQLLATTTRRVYRLGYQPHDWAQTALILSPGDSPIERWRDIKPTTWRGSALGDYEHLGLAVTRRGSLPVWTFFVALPKRTIEWRQAEPLYNLDWVRAEILAEVNEIRSTRGLPELVGDERLDRAAQSHAADLLARAYYDHQGRDGSTPRERAKRAGFRQATSIAENIAKGPFTPREVVQRWMRSSGHRRNLLDPRLRKLGCGVAFGENRRGFEVIWVQVFAD